MIIYFSVPTIESDLNGWSGAIQNEFIMKTLPLYKSLTDVSSITVRSRKFSRRLYKPWRLVNGIEMTRGAVIRRCTHWNLVV